MRIRPLMRLVGWIRARKQNWEQKLQKLDISPKVWRCHLLTDLNQIRWLWVKGGLAAVRKKWPGPAQLGIIHVTQRPEMTDHPRP